MHDPDDGGGGGGATVSQTGKIFTPPELSALILQTMSYLRRFGGPSASSLGAWEPLDSERLYRRRLRQVSGINGAGVEVMLRPRHQVIAL
jgi:hypothetical protein